MTAARMRVAFLCLILTPLLARADEPLAGRWEGVASIPGRELRMVVDLQQDSGGWKGALTLPGMNAKNGALADITFNNGEVAFATKTTLADPKNGPAKFTGRLQADGKLSGEFVQGGNRAPFALSKVGPPDLEPPPKSTAIAKEIEGEWKGSYELFGYPRKVTIKLQNGADGATADFLIVGKKENKLPVDLVTQNGDFIAIESHATGLSFEGSVGKGEIKGHVLQGPLEIPVVLKR